jgi:hypothetical protein
MTDLRKQLEEASGQSLRALSGQGKQSSSVAELLDKVTIGFSRVGYHLLIKNEAWLRPGGISAQEYVNTKEGTRFRGALLIRMSRGNIRAEVSLSSTEPARFLITLRGDQKPEMVERVDRSILARMRLSVDKMVEEQLGYTLRILM